MPRAIIIPMLVLLLITGAILLSGCTTETPIVNNTTPSINTTPSPHRQNVAEPGITIPIAGYVYTDDKAVEDAYVQAVSTDGTDIVTTVTNETGGYKLYLKARMKYRVNASYGGMEHSIFPVYRKSDVYDKSPYDINLSATPKSIIRGYTGTHHILVEAIPVNGGMARSAVSGYDNRTYRIEVEPDIQYKISASDYYRENHFDLRVYERYEYYPIFYIDPLDRSYLVKPGPNETIIVNVQVLWHI